MESIVVSLETSRKLKEAGWEPHDESFFYYISEDGENWDLNSADLDTLRPLPTTQILEAPTASEISEAIHEIAPQYTGSISTTRLRSGEYRTKVGEHGTALYGDTMADSLALMWVKLQGGE